MQINQGKFLQNGNCGYVLKPEFLLRDDFNPYYTNPPAGEEPIIITVKVRSHLTVKHFSKEKTLTCNFLLILDH